MPLVPTNVSTDEEETLGVYKVTEKPVRRRIKYACDHCGESSMLQFRAYAYWSQEKQEFVVEEIDWDADMYCDGCEEHVGYDEVMI